MRKGWRLWGAGVVCTYHLTNSTAHLRLGLRQPAARVRKLADDTGKRRKTKNLLKPLLVGICLWNSRST